MLLARLQRKTHGRVTRGILRNADKASGQATLVLIAGGEKRGVGSAVTERHAETLSADDHDVRAEFTGRFKQSEGQQIGRYDEGSAHRMDTRRQIPVIVDHTIRGGVLHQRTEAGSVEGDVAPRTGDNFNAERLGACAEQRDGLRVDIVGHEKFIPAFDPVCHGHGLGRSGRLVEQRGIGDFHACEIGHHGLEIEQRLETALG